MLILQIIIISNLSTMNAKLLENTAVDEDHSILKNATIKIKIPLKYLSNFWGSLEMPLNNYNVEL